MDDRYPPDLSYTHTFSLNLYDAVRATSDRLPFPQAGAWPPNYALKPNSGRLVVDYDFFSDAASWRDHLP